MREILMEIELLYNKMNEVNYENESKLGNINIPFSKILYAITRNYSKEELFNIGDKDLIQLIRKIQLIES